MELIKTGLFPQENCLAEIIFGHSSVHYRSLPFFPKKYKEISKLARAFEVACMDFELPGSRNQNTDRGHYGIVVTWIKELLTAVDRDFLSEVLDQLLMCNDEGVRWALARAVGELQVLPQSYVESILLKLILDDNSWVAREAIESLTLRGEERCVEALANALINRISEMMCKNMPERLDLMRPFHRLVERFPILMDKYTICSTGTEYKVNKSAKKGA